MLERFYDDDNKYEICIDEAGRGCLFGRVYIACVVLPKEPLLFDGTDIKDSKKFTSKTKINSKAEYIKQNSLGWFIHYVEAETIDKINILKSTMQGMHSCIKNTIEILKKKDNNIETSDITAVIDGNYFTPYMYYNSNTDTVEQLKYVTVEKGDGTYMGIAAASILAKTARDSYIEEMCNKYPKLDEYYGFKTNVGYATKKHREGISNYGITKWHRRTFGNACRNAKIIDIEEEENSED